MDEFIKDWEKFVTGVKGVWERLNKTYWKVRRWFLKYPKRTVIIGCLIVAACVALFMFIRFIFNYIVIVASLLFIFWDKLFGKSDVDNTVVMTDCTYCAVLEYYEKLKIRRPKVLDEINPSQNVKNNMSFWVIKEHPNAPIDGDILDEGRFFLKDYARLYSSRTGCKVYITYIKDTGGYLKINATTNNPKVTKQPATTPTTTDTQADNAVVYDDDF
jgi:hypothetical protein